MPIFILSSGSSSTPVGTLATIPKGATGSHYRRIALWITPAAIVTYKVDYESEVTDLVNAKDEPMMPLRFHHLVATGARAKEYEKKDDTTRWKLAMTEFQRGMNDLRYFVASGADVRPVMGRRTLQRPSVLGGWYESGT